MTVIRVAEIQGQRRQVTRAGGQALGGDARPQLPDVTAETEAGRAVKRVRQVVGGAAQHSGHLGEAGRPLEALADHELDGLDLVAPPPPYGW